MDFGCPSLVASLPASLKKLCWAAGHQHPKDSIIKGMQTQPSSPHFASLLVLPLFFLHCSWTWRHTCCLKGFRTKRGCDTKINCCRLVQLPVRDKDIGRTRLPCFMTKAASSFELRTQACTLTEFKKGVSDSVVARNHVWAIFIRKSMVTKMI